MLGLDWCTNLIGMSIMLYHCKRTNMFMIHVVIVMYTYFKFHSNQMSGSGLSGFVGKLIQRSSWFVGKLIQDLWLCGKINSRFVNTQ